ncbi:hypothetical protein [Pukyongiella litopenaei]|uniref:Uncharacterized protein n=1 Tax=Pukyongiella litopenaei TaxID=2605946 RepID=A0A2S0MSY2_9RHOB|nr:hypothetical protein [Pukyongiella litopenaei]AVO39008.1 hypothetical protein C6Y53_15685 [Pukyongiella litopenaei]
MTTFRIGFDGPSVDNGEIDVADLAPSLLALGEFFEAANRALNNDRADVKLKIRATEKGSFVALLSLDVSYISDILDFVAAHPDRVTAANQLLDLIIKGGTVVGGTVGFFKALKWLNGKKPEQVTRNDDGTTTLTKDGTTIVVDQRTIVLLEDYPTREATEKFVKTSFKPQGIQKVILDEANGSKDEPDLTLTKADVSSAIVPEPTKDEITETTVEREALLKIVSAQFEEGYLWRFTDGTNTFTASMEDADFVKRLDNSEVVLSKNDTLRCAIVEKQQLAGSHLKTETTITEVKEHISGARQLRLF